MSSVASRVPEGLHRPEGLAPPPAPDRAEAAEAVVVAVVLAVLSAAPLLLLLRVSKAGGSASGMAMLVTSVAILHMSALSMAVRAAAAIRYNRIHEKSVRASRALLAEAYADRDAVMLAAADLRALMEVVEDESQVVRKRQTPSTDALRVMHRIQLGLESRLRHLARDREALYRTGADDLAVLLDAERFGRQALLEADALLTRVGAPLPSVKSLRDEPWGLGLHRYEVDE